MFSHVDKKLCLRNFENFSIIMFNNIAYITNRFAESNKHEKILHIYHKNLNISDIMKMDIF